MTRTRLYSILILSTVTIGFAQQGAEAKSKKKDQMTSGACDQSFKAVVASGGDLSATDANGFDVLSRASLDRDSTLFNAWGVHHPMIKTAMKLNCPSAVSVLTTGGADPWKTKFYQSPRLNESQPDSIAVISIEDQRESKGKSEKLIGQMTAAVELQLSGSASPLHGFHLGYPIMRLSEVRQKLLAAGFSLEDAMAPDRMKACKALGADSVFEASLEDYRSRNVGVASAAAMRMKFALTDCKTGELLWKSDQDNTLAVGLLIETLGAGKMQEIITGTVGGGTIANSPIPAVGFPAYEGGKK